MDGYGRKETSSKGRSRYGGLRPFGPRFEEEENFLEGIHLKGGRISDLPTLEE